LDRQKKNLTNTDRLDRHWMLQYTLFKGDFFLDSMMFQ